MPLILTATDPHVIRWWVDASFAVHPDMKSHTGATMSMGRGSIYSLSTKQKINTRSSTEAELVGVNDAMSLIIWTRNFLDDQGFSIKDNVVFQDIMKAQCYWSEMIAHPAQNVHDTLRYNIFSSPTISTGVECVSATVQRIVWLPISSPSLYKGPVSGNFAISL